MPILNDQQTEESNESILCSIKEQCGIPSIRTEFDRILILDINTAFSILNQLGVGPENAFTISGDTETWDSFIVQDNMEMVKTFISLKVRQLFDPPIGVAAESLEKILDELVFRLNVAVNQNDKQYE